MKAKTKYNLIKYLGILLVALVCFLLTLVFTLCGAYECWKEIPNEGITTFGQWASIIAYRLFLYLLAPFLLSIFKFDKRYKWGSRFLIWLNWCLFIFIVAKAIYIFFAINMLNKNIEILSSLDSFIILAGYVMTYIKKKKVSFDSTGAIIDKNSYKE